MARKKTKAQNVASTDSRLFQRAVGDSHKAMKVKVRAGQSVSVVHGAALDYEENVRRTMELGETLTLGRDPDGYLIKEHRPWSRERAVANLEVAGIYPPSDDEGSLPPAA